jgi:2-keto-myo-inositol isomerase
MASSFAEDAEAFAGVGCTAVEVWLTKLETYLESHSAEEAKRLFGSRRLAPVAAAFQGGLLLSSASERRIHYDHFQKRLSLCQEFGIPTMIVVPDFHRRIDLVDLDQVRTALVQAAELASAFGVRLALEFQGRAAWCTSLDTAVALVESCGQPNLGICLDLFHYYVGPSKFEDLDLLTPANLFHVQVCDLAGTPRELAADADRILPGEGEFRLRPIVEHLRRIDYGGYVSVEVMNPVLWQMKPAMVAEAAFAALRRVLAA